jgi:hypothetical protein
MQGLIPQPMARRKFNNAPKVHHGDSIAEMLNHRQIVRNK